MLNVQEGIFIHFNRKKINAVQAEKYNCI